MNVLMELTSIIFASQISAPLQLASPNYVSFIFARFCSCSFHVFIILFFICHMELPIIILLCVKDILMVVSYMSNLF